MTWRVVCRVDEVPLGQWFLHLHQDLALAVVQTASGFYAFEDRCSHDETCLSDGWLRDDEVVCPRHAARFRLADGEALSPPAYLPMKVFELRIRADNIEVDIP